MGCTPEGIGTTHGRPNRACDSALLSLGGHPRGPLLPRRLEPDGATRPGHGRRSPALDDVETCLSLDGQDEQGPARRLRSSEHAGRRLAKPCSRPRSRPRAPPGRGLWCRLPRGGHSARARQEESAMARRRRASHAPAAARTRPAGLLRAGTGGTAPVPAVTNGRSRSDGRSCATRPYPRRCGARPWR